MSETAVLVATPDDADAEFALRWFTPTVEVALCGHATLASGHVILSREIDRARVRFRTRQAGVLEVARTAHGYRMALPAYAPAPSEDRRIARALGGEAKALFQHSNGYAVVLYASEADVRALTPDFSALRRMDDILAISTAPGNTADVVSRVFAASAGIDEDPVTGSAHAVIAPMWAERLGRPRFTAYQASARGGHMTCDVTADRVYLEAGCVSVIDGTFHLA